MQVVEVRRGYRLCEERVEELRPRLELLSRVVAQWEKAQDSWSADTDTDWYPTFTDFALAPAFRDCIDVSAETAFEDDVLLKMQSHMSDLAARWREDRKDDILKMITDALGSATPDDVDPLSLAVATFDCVFCPHKGMRWPQVIAHRCARWRELVPVKDESLYYRRAVIACERRGRWHMWDSEAFVFNPSLERSRAAIKACGEDPDTAIYEDMERCGVRVFCSDCQRRCEALDWKMAVRPLVFRSRYLPTYRCGHRHVTKRTALRPSSSSMRKIQPRRSSWRHSSSRRLRTPGLQMQISSTAVVVVATTDF